jgi:hypothetical protein
MSTHEPDLSSQQQRIDDLEREVDSLREQLHAAWGQLQMMRSSASWRVTYPLRAVRRLRRP